MPTNFAETNTEYIFFANGLNPMKKWDALSPLADNVGVPAPTTACVLGSGVPSNPSYKASGTYYAYVRFLDKDGNVSNLSPISNVLDATGSSGTLGVPTPGTPITITTTSAHFLVTGRVVIIQGCSLLLANGTWTITALSSTTFSLQNSTAPASRFTYPAGGSWKSAVGAITYTSLPVSTDPKIKTKQVLRNTNGQTDVFYVDLDDVANSTTSGYSIRHDTESFVDSFTSITVASLASQEAVPILDADGDLYANRNGIPPDHKPYIVMHQDRMYAAGDAEVNTGMVMVVNGSTTVTGINTDWTFALAGRNIYVNNGTKAYVISSVDALAEPQTLTLTAAYGEASNNYVSYGIRLDHEETRKFYFSEAGKPESWPSVNALALPSNGDQVTGLLVKGGFLYILERRHIHGFTTNGDPARDGFRYLASSRGCINNRCAVLVENIAYMLDEQGVHAFASEGSDTPLSDPIQPVFQPSATALYKINWTYRAYFHAAHDPQRQTVNFFVCLDGRNLPYHALVYDYRQRRWWIEEYPVPIGCSTLGYLSGQPQLFLGSMARTTLAPGFGTIDGPKTDASTIRGTATSATIKTLTDTAAAFASNVVNAPICITYGRGKGQRNRIASVSGTTLRMLYPWSTVPDTTSVYQIGGIQWRFVTKWFHYIDEEMDNGRRLELLVQPLANPCTLDARLYRNFSETPMNSSTTQTSAEGNSIASTEGYPDLVLDLTKDDGMFQKRFDGSKERYTEGKEWLKVELKGVANREPVRVLQINIDGVEG